MSILTESNKTQCISIDRNCKNKFSFYNCCTTLIKFYEMSFSRVILEDLWFVLMLMENPNWLDWFRLGTKDVQTLLCLQKFLFTKNGSKIDKYHNLRTIFNRNAFRNKAFYHVNEFWVIINVVKVMCFELIFIKCHIIANRQLLNLSCLTMQSNAT